MTTGSSALRADGFRRRHDAPFRFLYQSGSPGDLVEDLLARRAALPAVRGPIELTGASLDAFLAAREPGHYAHPAGYDEAQRDLDAITQLSALPRDVVAELLESDVPASERAALLRDYRAPTSVEDLWLTARALGRRLAGEISARGAVAVRLLGAELARFPNAELQLLHELAARGDIRLKAYVKKLAL
jgi:hypothetical protein